MVIELVNMMERLTPQDADIRRRTHPNEYFSLPPILQTESAILSHYDINDSLERMKRFKVQKNLMERIHNRFTTTIMQLCYSDGIIINNIFDLLEQPFTPEAIILFTNGLQYNPRMYKLSDILEGLKRVDNIYYTLNSSITNFISDFPLIFIIDKPSIIEYNPMTFYQFNERPFELELVIKWSFSFTQRFVDSIYFINNQTKMCPFCVNLLLGLDLDHPKIKTQNNKYTIML